MFRERGYRIDKLRDGIVVAQTKPTPRQRDAIRYARAAAGLLSNRNTWWRVTDVRSGRIVATFTFDMHASNFVSEL